MTAISSPVDSLIEAAKRLTRDERGEFFDRFTEVLEEDDRNNESPLSPEWMEEIKRRVADDDAGLTENYDLEDVLNEARESLKHPA
jgi:hypothetical protein